MPDLEWNGMCRESLSEAFRELSEKAVRSGWTEHDVALVLAELTEAYVAKVGARILIEGALQLQAASDHLKN